MQRILVAADIHANLPAFEAVVDGAGRVDACIVLGDVVGYGPHPAECISLLSELVHELPTWAIVGNHDTCALDHAGSWQGGVVGNGAEWDAWTAAQLDDAAATFLRQQPPDIAATFHGTPTYLCHHQSPLSSHVDDATVAEELETWEHAEGTALVLFGHFHRQIDWLVGDTRMVNSGSVGQPRGNDPTAAFAIWEPAGIRFQRVAYDVDRTVAALADMPMAPRYRETWEINYRRGIVDLSRE